MYVCVCVCVCCLFVATAPPMPKLSSNQDGAAKVVQLDMYYGKECAKTIHYYKFISEEINRLYKLMHQAALCFG